MTKNGLVVMTPTSIVSTGTGNSSSINANGSVTFSSCATLSLNGVFTSSYDNYMVVTRQIGTGFAYIRINMRSSGTDATGSNYAVQKVEVDGSSISAARYTSQTSTVEIAPTTNARSGQIFYFYGPNLARPTTIRGISASGAAGAYIHEGVATHNVSSSYDGFTLTLTTGALSGLVTVFGFNQ